MTRLVTPETLAARSHSAKNPAAWGVGDVDDGPDAAERVRQPVPSDQVQWEEQLVRFGTRYTGSPGHVAHVDWLAGQLSAIPGFSMRTDRLTFNRWLARQFALRVSVPATIGRTRPPAARPVRRSCSPRISPWAQRRRRSGAR